MFFVPHSRPLAGTPGMSVHHKRLNIWNTRAIDISPKNYHGFARDYHVFATGFIRVARDCPRVSEITRTLRPSVPTGGCVGHHIDASVGYDGLFNQDFRRGAVSTLNDVKAFLRGIELNAVDGVVTYYGIVLFILNAADASTSALIYEINIYFRVRR